MRRIALVLLVSTALVAAVAAGIASSAGAQASAPSPKALFVKNCGACHTMKAAGTKGTVGPNLDREKPSRALVVARITKGKGVMPSFKGKLTKAQIAALATWVSAKT